ncbi:nucleoside deaminase [Streptomyces sp. NPDC007901]|uniref:nucleoside deaminase n=1 Tax=Streptomyces sp. NPDC007901 TaxID=3364785 RepID=UPI0036EEBC49
MFKIAEDARFMRVALAQVRVGARAGQMPFGACVVVDGKLVSAEHNTVSTDLDVTRHAEVNALRQACRALGRIDLVGATVFTSCEPCPMCLAACFWAGVSRIVYSARVADAEAGGIRQLANAPQHLEALAAAGIEVVGDFLRDEGRAAFAEQETAGA